MHSTHKINTTLVGGICQDAFLYSLRVFAITSEIGTSSLSPFSSVLVAIKPSVSSFDNMLSITSVRLVLVDHLPR